MTTSDQKYPTVDGYQLVRQIGGGGFSTVFEAVNVTEKATVACKVIRLTSDTTEKARKAIEKEIRIHANLRHENILRFVNALVVEVREVQKFIPGIYILMELAGGGDLFDKIVPDVGVGEDIAHYYFNQLLTGMNYIHNEGVCHRDLKPENVLLDITGQVKISDFGLSAVYKLKDSGKTRTLSERCGSLPYVAPELNGGEPYQAEPIDVWGLGVILYAMLAGNTPWDEPSERSIEYSNYVSGDIFSEKPWRNFGSDALSLLRSLLCIDPKRRITIAEIFDHPWCIRPSQLAAEGSLAVIQKLSEPMHANGDFMIAAPNLAPVGEGMDVDEDGDALMASAQPAPTQFTQTLMLFSQTQHGTRHTPGLTRFYASLKPALLLPIIKEALEGLNVQTKVQNQMGVEFPAIRIGGYDRRKVIFKGWIIVENFKQGGHEGSFCRMNRDEGNPISWRQLWKALIQSDSVEPHVLRK